MHMLTVCAMSVDSADTSHVEMSVLSLIRRHKKNPCSPVSMDCDLHGSVSLSCHVSEMKLLCEYHYLFTHLPRTNRALSRDDQSISLHSRIWPHLLETCSPQPLSPRLSMSSQSPLWLCNSCYPRGQEVIRLVFSEGLCSTVRKTN